MSGPGLIMARLTYVARAIGLASALIGLASALSVLGTGIPAAQGVAGLEDAKRCLDETVKAPDLAIRYCDRALKNPDQLPLDTVVQTLMGRANAFTEKKQYNRATADLTEAIRLNPEPFLFFLRGKTWTAREDFDRAIADYDEAIRTSKGEIPLLWYSFRGNAFANKSDYERAFEDLNTAVRLDPKSPIALYIRGMAKLRKGDKADGNADIAAAEAMWPGVRNQIVATGLK